MKEIDILRMFLKICNAIKCMHTYSLTPNNSDLFPYAHKDIKPG